MNSRERVRLALNHQEPDRVPIDLGGTIVSSIASVTYQRVRDFLGLPKEEMKIIDRVQGLPYINEDLLSIFKIDFRMIQVEYITVQEQSFSEEKGYHYFIDRWGAKLRKPKEKGLYFDWVEFPIMDEESLEKYKWPEPDETGTIIGLKQVAEKLGRETDFALVGSSIFGGGIAEQPGRMMGLENFFINLALNKGFINKIMENILDIYIENTKRYLDILGEYLDVFVYWDDIGSQNSLLFSPDDYRSLIKPKQRKLFDVIKSRTDAKLFYHSCGAIKELIPDLIEIGVDILNPVQVSSPGMDTKELKKEFGRDIVFWGGGCDTQNILPFGSSEDVRNEVKRRISELAPGGGFVFNAVHNIQADVPPENVAAMYETALEFGKYK
jgi:uroporphyrinogen decarboxylase